MIPRKSSETLVQSALELIFNCKNKNIIDSINNGECHSDDDDVYYDDDKVINNNDIENKNDSSDNTHISEINDYPHSFSNDIKINSVHENKATYPLGVHGNKATYPYRVLDIGVGSGCLLLSCINSIKLYNENLGSNNNDNRNSNDSNNDNRNGDSNNNNTSNHSNKIPFTGAFIFCVHYLCLIERVYVFYVGHVDESI
jgi:hypothetical protein